jgi:hypothetical protein
MPTAKKSPGGTELPPSSISYGFGSGTSALEETDEAPAKRFFVILGAAQLRCESRILRFFGRLRLPQNDRYESFAKGSFIITAGRPEFLAAARQLLPAP